MYSVSNFCLLLSGQTPTRRKTKTKNEAPMKNTIEPHHILVPLLTAVLIFLACPLFIASQNAAEISAFPLGSLIKNGVFLSIVTLVIYLPIMLLLRARPLANAAAIFLLCFVFLTTYILPVTIAPGLIAPHEHEINGVNLALSLLIAAIITGACTIRPEVLRFSLVALIAMSGASLVSSALGINNAVKADAATRGDDFTRISSKRNTLVISFDGVPGPVVTDVLTGTGRNSAAFKDFIYFPNTLSQSPATHASGFGSVYGVQDFKSFGNNTTEVLRGMENGELQKNLYFTKVDDFKQSYRGLNLFPETNPLERTEKHTPGFILNSGFSRIFTRHIFKTGIPQLVEKITLTDKTQDALDPDTHQGEEWDFKHIADINHWDAFFTSFTASDENDFSVRYVHFVFTHFPVDLDASCAYRADSAAWFEANQNYEGIKNEAICALDKAETLIRRLKKLGVYDNTTIVFKSDHGKPANFYDGPPSNLTFNNHPLWGYDRYRPFLLVKAASAQRPSMKVDERVVLLNDMAKTLCLDSEIEDLDCSVYKGLDLFSDDPTPDDPYFLYIVKDAKSNFRFETHRSVEIPSRHVDLVEHMDSLDIVTGGASAQ